MADTRILIVEDELLVAEDIKETLSRNNNYNVKITTDGREAINIANEYKPELVMMDIKLRSRPDGIEAGLKIKEICKSGIVFVTAFADNKTVKRALRVEPFGFIVKPFTEKELFATVETALIRYKIERALYEHGEWTNQVIENLPNVILFKDQNYLYHPISKMFFELCSNYKDRIINKSDFDILPFNIAKKIRAEDEELRRRNKNVIKKEFFSDLLKKWLSVVKFPVFNSDNKFLGIVVTVRDISDEKEKNMSINYFKTDLEKKKNVIVKKNRRLKKEVYRRILTRELVNKLYNREKLILDSIPEYMVFYNKSYKIEWLNKVVIEKVGLPFKMIQGKRCSEIRLCKLDDIKVCPVYQALQSGIQKESEIVFNDKVWLVRAFPVKDKNQSLQGVLEVISDITKKKMLEKQFIQSQKVEIVGKLVNGIAHDFNNILTVIKGYSELLLQDITPENIFYNDIDEIHEASKRAEILVRRLLAFTKKDVVKKEYISVNEILKSMKGMLDRLLEDEIILKAYLYPNIPNIYMDKSHLEQIIMNLIVNAKEAMPNGGEIRITTRMLRNEHSNNIFKDKNYVVLSVEDNGIGMDKDTRSRIFEPFFSMKKQGTGLGLATVKEIVELYEGFITVNSELGKGTEFNIFFKI